MIDITKLFNEEEKQGDYLRYKKGGVHKRPIVVWNCTRRCNLNCVHCYSDSENKDYPNELSTDEAKVMIKDLADFGVPVFLFSGGEPFLRTDLFELIEFTKKSGMVPVISTNGTVISPTAAKRVKELGVRYVGISLDGIGEINDKFRGKAGAFVDAMQGFRNCVDAGQRVGLRLTLTKRNCADIDNIFDFIERENINRACFYHLVYCGRGSSMVGDDLTHDETRKAIDRILVRTEDLYKRGLKKELLTVDNHTDGVYIYQTLKKTDPKKAEMFYDLLKINGGNNSGIGIGCIDNVGNVHADQFWTSHSFGNVLKRPFSEIWMDTTDPLMKGLKDRKKLLKGKCAKCHYQEICNGNFRVRAEVVYKDPWAEDPACYLTEEEVTS